MASASTTLRQESNKNEMDAQSERLLGQVIRSARIAVLGTWRDEAPLLSALPFISAEDFSMFYIYVSRLAQYTVDMQKDKHVGLLISEADDGRPDSQSLAWVSIRGSAEQFPYGEPGYTPLKQRYLNRFPESEALFGLDDFGFWRIRPKGGHYVAGLSKALTFNITVETLQKVSEN